MPFNESTGLNNLAKQDRQFYWEVIKRTSQFITRRKVWISEK